VEAALAEVILDLEQAERCEIFSWVRDYYGMNNLLLGPAALVVGPAQKNNIVPALQKAVRTYQNYWISMP